VRVGTYDDSASAESAQEHWSLANQTKLHNAAQIPGQIPKVVVMPEAPGCSRLLPIRSSRLRGSHTYTIAHAI
jgi:hypothetical protein